MYQKIMNEKISHYSEDVTSDFTDFTDFKVKFSFKKTF